MWPQMELASDHTWTSGENGCSEKSITNGRIEKTSTDPEKDPCVGSEGEPERETYV